MQNFVEITSNDNWFKQHPEKIAGVEYETTSFYFPIMVKGTKDDVLRVTGMNKNNDMKKLALAKAKAKALKIKLSFGKLGMVNLYKSGISRYILKTIPIKMIIWIEKNFDNVYFSPFSDSFYSKPGQTWDFSPKEQIRISDHWNFWSKNYNDPFAELNIHSQTYPNVKNNTHWTIAKKNEHGIYEVVMSLPKRVDNSVLAYDKLENKEINSILKRQIEINDIKKRKLEFKKLQDARLKSTSKQTLAKKIEKVFLELNKRKLSFEYIEISKILNKVDVIRPVYQTGSGRRTKTNDCTKFIDSVLEKLNLIYEVGNDAPRGGIMGTYIKVITKIK